MTCHTGRLLPGRLRQMASKMVLTTAQSLIHMDSPGTLAFLRERMGFETWDSWRWKEAVMLLLS